MDNRKNALESPNGENPTPGSRLFKKIEIRGLPARDKATPEAVTGDFFAMQRDNAEGKAHGL